MSTYETKVHQFKVDYVEKYKNRFRQSKDFIFADYRGLSVEQISQLRSKLRERNADFRVIKNRYAKLALNQMEMPDVSAFLTGPTAIAMSPDDSGPIVKALLDFAQDSTVQVKGAIVDGMVFDAAQAEELSKLPSREELLAKLMGTMNAPLQHFLYALNGVPTKLVRTLKAVEEQKRAQG